MAVQRRTSREADAIAPPEPDLTSAEMLRRAVAMRPVLRERQDRTEAHGAILPETNDEFIAAGFYRIIQPRRFGGYEFDIETFFRVMIEIARGCPSSGWVLALTAGHPLMLAVYSDAAHFDAYGGDGEFRAPAVGSPVVATPVEGGYRVSGGWDYASGCDTATHLLGGAMRPGADGHPIHMHLLVERAQFSIVNNWQMVGMEGTGSRRAVVENVFIPAHRAVDWTIWMDPPARDMNNRLLRNPYYHGRKPTFFIGEAVAVAVGIARGALDLYQEILAKPQRGLMGGGTRVELHEYQEYWGLARAWIDTAENALLQVGRDYTEHCRALVEDGVPFTNEADRAMVLVEQHCVKLAWEATDLLFTTAGTSSGRKDSKLARHFRDLAVLRTHGTMRYMRTAPDLTRVHFGLAPLSPI
ncbi:MAG TPA: oxidoreductase [Stellaceae bacterium]|nr:oxidoreductase [Stellaceae bacterium]